MWRAPPGENQLHWMALSDILQENHGKPWHVIGKSMVSGDGENCLVISGAVVFPIYIRQTCWFCMVSSGLSRWIYSKICSWSPNFWRLAFCRGACQSVIHLRGRGIWQTRVISPAIARNWRGSPSQKHTSMDWLKGKSAKKSPFWRVFLPAIRKGFALHFPTQCCEPKSGCGLLIQPMPNVVQHFPLRCKVGVKLTMAHQTESQTF